MQKFIVALTVTTMCAYWTARGINRYLLRSYTGDLTESASPMTIAGLRFSLDGLSGPGREWPANQAASLVFVVADSCGLCGSIVPAWTNWLDDMSRGLLVRASIITFDGNVYASQLATTLAKKGVVHRVLEVNRRDAFRLATGIQSTPQVLILDVDERVRFVAVGFGELERRTASHWLSANARLTGMD